ncbi:MAG: DNA-binding protein WhiA [Fervidobacterium sp.]
MKYTFSEEVKGELCQVEIMSSEEAKSELAGYLKGKGILVKTSTDSYISLEVGFIPAARRIMNLMAQLGIDKKKLTMIKNRLQKKRVQIFIPSDVLDKIEVSILDIPDIISKDIGFFGAFLRGFFVSTGSITSPAKHYHIEFVSYNLSLLEHINNLLLEMLGISGNIAQLNNNYRYYIKKGKDIQELLELMGAIRGAGVIDRIITSREIKCDINRSLNFIAANAKRTGESNARQIASIQLIKDTIGLEKLPKELRDIAILRLEHEDLSLTELGEYFDPPLTKSMVYNRLKKLMNIAESISLNQEDKSNQVSE